MRSSGSSCHQRRSISIDLERHYGLHGMRERAELIGGKLTVRTAPGSGTEIELSVPAVPAYAIPSALGHSWSEILFQRWTRNQS